MQEEGEEEVMDRYSFVIKVAGLLRVSRSPARFGEGRRRVERLICLYILGLLQSDSSFVDRLYSRYLEGGGSGRG